MSDQKLIQGGIFLTLSSFVFMLSGYLINIWLGKTLGIIDYGIYGVVISLMTTLNIIQTSGLPQAAAKKIASGQSETDQVLKASLTIQIVSTLCVSLLLFSFSKPIASLLNDLSLARYIRMSSLILPFYAIFSLYVGYYNGLHQFKRQAVLYIVYSIAKFIAVIGLVYVFRLYGAIIGFIVSPIIALFFGFRLPKRVKAPRELYKSLIIFSLPLIGYAILSTMQLSIDLLFVKGLSGTDSAWAGLYTAGQNISRIPYYALSAFALMLFPIVTKSIHTESPAETGKKINGILRNLFLFLIPGTLFIVLTSGRLLSLFYSQAYLGAAGSLSWLVVGVSLLTVLNALTYVLVGDNRPTAAMVLSGAGVAITGVICLIAIPDYGLLGASLGTTAGALTTTVIAFMMLSNRFPSIVPWKSLVKMSAAAIAMCLAYFLVFRYFHSWYALPFLYLILASVYAALLVLAGELSRHDLQAVKQLIAHGKN